jgi:hypothetical protein
MWLTIQHRYAVLVTTTALAVFHIVRHTDTLIVIHLRVTNSSD